MRRSSGRSLGSTSSPNGPNDSLVIGSTLILYALTMRSPPDPQSNYRSIVTSQDTGIMTRNIGLTERTSLIVSQLKDGQPSAWPAVDSVARTPHQSRGVASRCGAKTPQYTHYGRWQIATTVRIYRQRAVRSWATGHQPLRSTGFGGTTVPTKNKTWSTRREVVIVMGQRDSRLISPQSCPTEGVQLREPGRHTPSWFPPDHLSPAQRCRGRPLRLDPRRLLAGVPAVSP